MLGGMWEIPQTALDAQGPPDLARELEPIVELVGRVPEQLIVARVGDQLRLRVLFLAEDEARALLVDVEAVLDDDAAKEPPRFRDVEVAQGEDRGRGGSS